MQLMQPRMVLPGATKMTCQQTCKPLITRQDTDLHAESNDGLAGDDMMHDTNWHADMVLHVLPASSQYTSGCSMLNTWGEEYSNTPSMDYVVTQQFTCKHWNRPGHCAAAAAVQVAHD